jgi:DNA-binding NarL/FixJ family response regulator
LVHSGKKYFRGPIAASIEKSHGPDLSGRELEVLTLVAKGLSNKRIVYSLKIADNTVQTI